MEKVRVEWVNDDGTITRREMPEIAFSAALEKLEVAGHATAVEACIAHFLDSVRGEYAESWIIGDDIRREIYQQYSDEGDVYLVTFYEKGAPVMKFRKKKFWESMRRIAERIRSRDVDDARDVLDPLFRAL